MKKALERGKKYLKAGADGLFIEAPESENELKIIGKTFYDVPLIANMLNGGKTPILDREKLEKMGFNLICYPSLTLLLMTKAIKEGLKILRNTGCTKEIEKEKIASMEEFHKLIGVIKALKKEKKLTR